MSIVVLCPDCNTRLTLDDDRAGTTFECPKCYNPMTIPLPTPKVRPAFEVVEDSETESGVETRKRQRRRRQMDEDEEEQTSRKGPTTFSKFFGGTFGIISAILLGIAVVFLSICVMCGGMCGGCATLGLMMHPTGKEKGADKEIKEKGADKEMRRR